MPKRLILLLVLVVATLASVTGRTVAQTPPGTYFLVVGDSLAYGLTAPDIAADPGCSSPTARGYVCIVFGYLKQVQPSLQLQNLAVREMDSCILVYGFSNGSPCTTAPPGGNVASPLSAAVAFLKAHPGQVGPVTVNVGGADLVPLLPAAVSDPAGTAAKLPALFRSIQANLDTALSQLRSAAGPSTQIILISQYNPLGGITSPPLPSGLPEIATGAIRSLNQLEGGVAAKYNVKVADVAGAFDANPGGAALLTFVPPTLASGDPSKIDIYPTIDGYRIMGQTVLKAVGDAAPSRMSARVSTKSARTGKSVKLTGTTISGATVKVTVALPKARSKSVSVTADNNGAFAFSLSVGKRKGSATFKACGMDLVTGHTACSKKLTVAVK